MDPVSTAIIAALANLSEKVISDSYQGLKELIKKKFGQESNLVRSIDELEKKPDSGPRQEVLKEEVAEANAHEDKEILEAISPLMDKLAAKDPNLTAIKISISGGEVQGIIGAGHVNVSRLNIGKNDKN